ncbi:MAG: tetratricopeptide repeat protein [Ardenticatenaceae bacterium]|nr:tetratricopeptide repeat protein [Ardenticatenaceae bacterium]
MHRGKVNDAVTVLQKAHELQPEHFDAALNLSGAYILTKKFKQAAALLEKLREQAPNNAMVWTNLGAAYLGNPVLAREEEQLQAIAAFEQALAIDPVAPNVAYNIGLIYRDRREYDMAIAWFKRALQANPNDKDARDLIKKLNDMNGRT